MRQRKREEERSPKMWMFGGDEEKESRTEKRDSEVGDGEGKGDVEEIWQVRGQKGGTKVAGERAGRREQR